MTEFVCDACGETCRSDWPDEEARAEAEAAFTPEELTDTVIVCEDCWQAMRAAPIGLDERYS